jgi:hypothetical protein
MHAEGEEGGEVTVAWGDNEEENGPWGGPSTGKWETEESEGTPVEWWGKKEEEEMKLEWPKEEEVGMSGSGSDELPDLLPDEDEDEYEKVGDERLKVIWEWLRL